MNRILRDEYRSDEEVEEWKRRDPIDLFKALLIDQNIASVNEINKLQESVTEAIADALQFARESPYPNEEDLWEDLYADPLPA